MIHLDDSDMALLKKILAVFAPEDCRILAFGSRVTGKRLKRHSDIDLCLVGKTPIASRSLSDLKDALSNSNLSIRVDVVDWHALSPEFRVIVEAQTEEITL